MHRFFGVLGLLALLGVFSACQEAAQPFPTPQPTPTTNPLPSPSPEPPSMINFVAFGDWGTGDATQDNVAQALESHCMEKPCDFALLLGDNFYDVGVASAFDTQWEDKFENVYTLDVPFYAVLGNHDYDGNEDAQIEYSQYSERWRMPAKNYQVRFPEGANPPLLEIFAIDSNAVDSTTASALAQALNASSALWKIAAMHHPLYSNGPHPDDQLGQNALLLPALCPSVDAVFVGHNHFFSVLDDPNDGCRFLEFIVGTGGRPLHAFQADSRTLAAQAAHGFSSVEVTTDAMTIEFHALGASDPYQITLHRDGE